MPGHTVTGQGSLPRIALQGLDVNIAEQFGSLFASNQGLEHLRQLIRGGDRFWSGQGIGAISPCGRAQRPGNE